MYAKRTSSPFGLTLIALGLLILLTVIFPRVDHLGPVVLYRLGGLGSTRAAVADLEREVEEIGDLIREQQQGQEEGPLPDLVWPTPGWGEITSEYGPRLHPVLGVPKVHAGVDIGAPEGAAVEAVRGGEVILVASFTAYGNLLVIDHGDQWASVYAHLSTMHVEKGDRVEQGDVIGEVGATGRVTGPHLHLELRRGGEPVDPMGFKFCSDPC